MVRYSVHSLTLQPTTLRSSVKRLKCNFPGLESMRQNGLQATFGVEMSQFSELFENF